MYEVGVVDQFEAAHSLKGNFGPATRKHGHTYRVELTVRGEKLQADGTLCDIGQMADALRAALSPLHFQDLDELAPLRGRNTTAENLAEYLLDAIQPTIKSIGGLSLLTVKVWESPDAFAAIERPVAPKTRT